MDSSMIPGSGSDSGQSDSLLRYQEPWTSTQDLGYDRATDPDLAYGHSLGPDTNMALGGSSGHSDLYVPSGNMTLGQHHDLRCQPMPQAYA